MEKLFRLIILTLFLGVTNSLYAQIETKTETIGNGELSSTMDKRILDTIENLEEKCKKGNNKTTNSIPSTSNSSSSTKPTKALTNAEICKQNPRILGYKIQVAVVKSKDEADKIRIAFREKFPTIKVEIDASLRPNYKILAGSYFSKESAKPDLKKIKASFGSATSVPYRVFCAEAK